MVKSLAPWRLLVAVMLPAAVAFTTTSPKQNYPTTSRIGGSPLYAAKQATKAAADVVTEAVSSTPDPAASLSASWNDLTSKLTAGSGTESVSVNPQEAFATIVKALDSLLQQSLTKMDALLQQINEAFVGLLSSLAKTDGASGGSPLAALEPLLAKIKEGAAGLGISSEDITKLADLVETSAGALNTPETIAATTVISYVVVNALLTWGESPPPGKPYPIGKYDPVGARIYFDRRPLQVAARALTIASKSLAFALALVQDKLRGDETWTSNQEQRGLELAQLLTELGPTFIKIGQSLSIRTDLLSPAYIRGLSSLQDRVPAFDTATAKLILEEEWGVPVDQVLEGGLSETASPVAAASLGQVYKAKLKGSGKEVAIKVQRPKITNQIALDMHLLREAAPIARRTFNLNTDTEGTVDAWGAGFVDELDYLQEASNGQYFMEQLQNTSLKDVVLAPTVVDEFTSGKVLVTEWIDGERLDRSSQADVTILCSICMNTYLTMLLEMGLLHCDPHPGNLLRTPDGKLCILDWGMVTSIPPQLQLTLIEHMAHLTSRDYAEVPRDLYLLGFVPADKEQVIEDSGVVDVLADIYGQWTDGGGMASINANEVLSQMQDLASTRGNLFQIPPYFAYIAKSFSVLEGIGLSNDAKYSIIEECLPYVSNRLLTDQVSMGNALNTFIFGPDKYNIDTRLVDPDRIEQLVSGFGDFASTTASGALSTPTGEKSEVGANSTTTSVDQLEQVADQVLDVLLTEEETPLQKILIEQVAKILAANTRSLWTEARLRSGVLPSGRTVLGSLVDPLGLFQTSPLVNKNEQDERAVKTTEELVTLLSKIQSKGDNSGIDIQSLNNEELIVLSRVLSTKLWERRTALIKSSNRFVNQMLQLTAIRLESADRVPVGERTPTVGVPSETTSESANDASDSDSSSSPFSSPSRSQASNPSPRLQQARDRLNSLTSQ
ncbi:unnamed protein product [Pseudo-nitzschia multistriata]|uniref:ABC1 atypical kinase-like domain-containing protein n=1 Tax=Pseudo-nitzschia multistriata TaxID=183589 RepID=A0A448YZS6_9STRA|nr:unnamed protein product [Pseudo-nitzschia multistriata]